MADQTTYLRAFNTLVSEFVDDLELVFPGDKLIKQCTTTIRTVRKANPKIIIRVWNKYVMTPYGEHIEKGDIDYFCNKDYNEDLTSLQHSEHVAQSIEVLRSSIKGMDVANKAHTVVYLQKLNKLCNGYWSDVRILKNNQHAHKDDLKNIDLTKIELISGAF